MEDVLSWRTRLRTRQCAREALEYGILVAVVAVAIIAGLGAYGQVQKGYFSSLAQPIVATSPDTTILDSGSTGGGCPLPAQPAVTSPSGSTSRSAGSTIPIMGTADPGSLVNVYDASGNTAGSQQLSFGATSYAIDVTLATGPNRFQVTATTACGTSGPTAVATIIGT
jgi:Flp pilus assembly pilin Flp